MGRFPQPLCTKGSQRWLQWLVNEAPELLDQPIGLGQIDWRSPLRADDYAEYRDQAFLDLLDIRLPTRPLAFFWRAGRNGTRSAARRPGEVILVEAKATRKRAVLTGHRRVGRIEPRQIQASLAACVSAGSPQRRPDAAGVLVPDRRCGCRRSRHSRGMGDGDSHRAWGAGVAGASSVRDGRVH